MEILFYPEQNFVGALFGGDNFKSPFRSYRATESKQGRQNRNRMSLQWTQLTIQTGHRGCCTPFCNILHYVLVVTGPERSILDLCLSIQPLTSSKLQTKEQIRSRSILSGSYPRQHRQFQKIETYSRSGNI